MLQRGPRLSHRTLSKAAGSSTQSPAGRRTPEIWVLRLNRRRPTWNCAASFDRAAVGPVCQGERASRWRLARSRFAVISQCLASSGFRAVPVQERERAEPVQKDTRGF